MFVLNFFKYKNVIHITLNYSCEVFLVSGLYLYVLTHNVYKCEHPVPSSIMMIISLSHLHYMKYLMCVLIFPRWKNKHYKPYIQPTYNQHTNTIIITIFTLAYVFITRHIKLFNLKCYLTDIITYFIHHI